MKSVMDYFLAEDQGRLEQMHNLIANKVMAAYSIEPDEVETQLLEFAKRCQGVHGVIDENGDSLLHVAVGHDRDDYRMELAIVKALVDSGADLYAQDRSGKTVMQKAFEQGKIHVINYLADVIEERLNRELAESILAADLDGIVSAVKRGADANVCLNHADNKNVAVFIGSDWLKINEDRDYHQINGVHLACAAGRPDVVDLLMAAGGQQCALKVSRFGFRGGHSECSAFGIAINRGDTESLKVLAKNSAKEALNAALKDAITTEGRRDIDYMLNIRILIEHGADIHAISNEGKTILSYARSQETSRMMVEYSAAVAEKNSLDSNIKEGLDEEPYMGF